MTAPDITPLSKCGGARRSAQVRIGHTIVIHVRLPGTTGIPPERESGEKSSEHTCHKHRELRGRLMHPALEQTALRSAGTP